jgi:signal transduction histidine kinase/ActR/RegA family two-component response regulator
MSTRSRRGDVVAKLTLVDLSGPAALLAVAAMVFGSWLIAYYLGGGTNVAPHWFYLPIFLAGLRFGLVGALVTGIIATFVAGPLLPADVATHSPQLLSDWVSRGIFFVLIGLFVTALFDWLKRLAERETSHASEVTEAYERSVEASNLKSAFLANISHEIRTPMNGVIGMTELLLSSELSGDQRECAEQLARSGELMMAVLGDVLDISKLEAGLVKVENLDFDLHATIEHACALPSLEAREKGLRFEVRIDDGVPRTVHGDGLRVTQILLNLLTNAVKFTEAGSVTLHVSATPGPERAALIRIALTDTGIGIDPAHIEHVFEPFRQADVSTTRLYGGSGLGLTITRELVELMGGTIRAESQPGSGSTFTIELELATVGTAGSRAPPTDGTAARVPAWQGSPLVLVVEDSPVNQIVAVRVLERCGCRTELAADGHEALQALARNHYDAVLMDCQMPGLDGYAATAELRRRETDGRHTPVIAMTAHAMDGDRERCLQAGMDDYISKPMKHAILAGTLRRWLSRPPETPGTPLPAHSAPRPPDPVTPAR